MLKTLGIFLLLLIPILIVGYMDGQAFEFCENHPTLSYETCLAMHGIK